MNIVTFRRAARPGVVLVAATVVATLVDVAAAQVRCGERVGAGRHVVLAADLECGDAGAALRLEDGATLDLGGFAIRCRNGGGPRAASGVFLDGSGAVLRNGTVQGCSHGIVVDGTGRHTIEDVVVAASGVSGVVVASHRNRVERAVVLGSGARGFVVSGVGNRLVDGVAIGNGNVGFLVSGRSTLIGNVASDNGEAGFIVASNFGVLTANRASGSRVGFFVRGRANRLERNEGAGNVSGVVLDAFSRGNLLLHNVMRDNLFSGFFGHGGSGNKLLANRAQDNGAHGVILLEASSRTLVHGTVAARNGAADLADETSGCGSNRWRENAFATSNQTCIE